MVATATVQDFNEVLSRLMDNGAGALRNKQSQADIAAQIERELAPFFGGGDDSIIDSLIASCTSGGTSGDSTLDSIIGSYSSGASSNDPVGDSIVSSYSSGASSSDPVFDSMVASYEATLSADASFGADGASGGGGASAAPYSGGSGGGKPVADYFMTHLQKDFGLTKNQAAGIVANLWYESGGMNPNMNEGMQRGAPTSNMGQGYGVAQWTGSRKREFLDFAAAHGMKPDSVEANYAFLKHELQTSHADAIRAVKGTSSAQAATTAFCNVFEVPGVPALDKRYAALAQVLPSGGSVLV